MQFRRRPSATGRGFFLERRELGAINTGGPGEVCVDGQRFAVAPLACIYVGMGAQHVSFASGDPANPAKFFILSCPAHAAYPTTVATREQATLIELGSQATANQRVIRQYIHESGIPSCQLVMGYTELAEGSVWNTFPPHTHHRRRRLPQRHHPQRRRRLAQPLTRQNLRLWLHPGRSTASYRRLASGGVLVSTGCLMCWLHVEVDRLAS